VLGSSGSWFHSPGTHGYKSAAEFAGHLCLTLMVPRNASRKILDRESAIARISTGSFSDRLWSRAGEQARTPFEVVEEVEHFAVTSLKAEKG
jgi:hypothetical protein